MFHPKKISPFDVTPCNPTFLTLCCVHVLDLCNLLTWHEDETCSGDTALKLIHFWPMFLFFTPENRKFLALGVEKD